MSPLRSIDLRLREELKDPEFRRAWFRAQLGAAVPDMFRKLRELRKFTQEEIASKTDMKQSAVSRFEKSDEANWNLETLLKLADAVDVKLTIGYELAEDVIAEYERKEQPQNRDTASIFDGHDSAQNEAFNQGRGGLIDLDAFGSDLSEPKIPSLGTMADRGHRPWN